MGLASLEIATTTQIQTLGLCIHGFTRAGRYSGPQATSDMRSVMLGQEVQLLFPNTSQTGVSTESLHFLPLLTIVFDRQCCISIRVQLHVGRQPDIPFSDLYMVHLPNTTRSALSIPQRTILTHHTRAAAP